MKTLKSEVKSKKKNIIKPPLLQAIISSVIKFDKSFHPVVQYENYLICIFMNINENLKMIKNKTKQTHIRLASIPECNQTYIEHLVHFLMDANFFNGTTECKKKYCPKIRPLWLCEIA